MGHLLGRLLHREEEEPSGEDAHGDATEDDVQIPPSHVGPLGAAGNDASLARRESGRARVLGHDPVRDAARNDDSKRLEQRQCGEEESSVRGQELERNRRIDGDVASDSEATGGNGRKTTRSARAWGGW